MIYDDCLKLYTLIGYINLKICVLSDDDSIFHFLVTEFFLVKKRFFFSRHIVSWKLFIIATNFIRDDSLFCYSS